MNFSDDIGEDFKKFIDEHVAPIDFSKFEIKGRIVLNEDDGDFGGGDDGGDMGGGDDGGDMGGGDPFSEGGGDDMGGGDDPFGGDDGGSEGGDSGDADNGEEKDKEDTDDTHEDDPDFTMGSKNGDDLTLSDKPPVSMMYDTDKVFSALKAVKTACTEKQLAEFDKVENCTNLIFNGKKLNPEDLEFENIENAIFLINKVKALLDEPTANYYSLKLGQPINDILLKNKSEMAELKSDSDKLRDLAIKTK